MIATLIILFALSTTPTIYDAGVEKGQGVTCEESKIFYCKKDVSRNSVRNVYTSNNSNIIGSNFSRNESL